MTTSNAEVVVDGWRWCRAKGAPEVWEDGNGCLWCFEDTPGDHQLIATLPAPDDSEGR